ncbi:MAG: tetratricopeptide repeat protein, partial [Saprospiraceae bacterium]|nr:tetratricopeptide repeat protein [Saprospiraceae bacterium]
EAAQKGLERLEVQTTQYLKSDDLVLAKKKKKKGRLGIESGSYKNGKEELLKSLAIKKSLGLEDNDIGLTYFQLGNAYREMGDLEKGMEAYQKCLSIREKISGKKSIESIPVYTNIATLLKNSNRFEEALDMYLTCDSAILNHYGSEDKQRAAILNGIAIVYAQTGRYPEALQYFTNLLKIDRQTLGEKHPYLARTYSNLGILHELMGDYQSAQDFHKKSLAIKLESFEPENPNLISDYQGLSTIMTHIGDIDQALIYQQQVLQIERASYSPSDPRIGTTYEMLAANLISKGEYEEAWKNLQMSEKIYLHNGKYSLQLGSVYHSMAIILLSQHQDPEALVYAFQALKINKKLGTNHPHVAGNYELIGNIYLNQHQIDSAKHQYQLALQINEKVYGKKHLSVASNYGQLAEAYFDSGDYDQALDYIQRALNAATEGFSYRTISDNPTPEQTLAPSTVATLLGKKGKILNHQANLLKDLNLLLEASHTFEAAISMIDAAQFSYKAQGSVLTLREELDPVFEQAIEVTYQLFDQTQDKIYIDRAFQISEKNKAALLVSALNESRARTFAEIPDSLIEEENRLQRDLTYFEQLLSEEKTTEQSDDQKIKEIQSNIFRLKNQYDLLIESYNRLYPRYYDLKYNAQPITIEQVQKKLTNYHGLLIEYYLGQEHLYIFVISHTQEHLYR